MMPDPSCRLGVAATVQDVLGSEASPVEITPLTLTAVTNLAAILEYIATILYHVEAAIAALKH